MRIFCFFLFLALVTTTQPLIAVDLEGVAHPADSIGLRVVNGKTHIVHQVDPGETLYGIARHYKVTVADVRLANQLNVDALSVGQTLLIPTTIPSTANVDQTPKTKKHTVEKGETLYSLSRLYGVTVDAIKSANNLSDNSLSPGQNLLIPLLSGSAKADAGQNQVSKPVAEKTTTISKPIKPEPVKKEEPASVLKRGTHVVQDGETFYSISQQYNMSIKELRMLNPDSDIDIKKGQKLTVTVANGAENKSIPIPEMDDPTSRPVDEIFNLNNSNDGPAGEGEYELAPSEGGEWEIPASATRQSALTSGTNVPIWQVTEKGRFTSLPGNAGVQNKFYAGHSTLPKGAVIRIENARLQQFVTVTVRFQTPENQPGIIALTEKAKLYLMLKTGDEVTIRYTVPRKE